jgi:hypothetical protein
VTNQPKRPPSQATHALTRDVPRHYDPTDPHDPPAHDHYHVVTRVYDGDTLIGETVHHWHVHRAEDTPQGAQFTHSQVYAEPDGKHVMLAVRSQATRQVID